MHGELVIKRKAFGENENGTETADGRLVPVLQGGLGQFLGRLRQRFEGGAGGVLLLVSPLLQGLSGAPL